MPDPKNECNPFDNCKKKKVFKGTNHGTQKRKDNDPADKVVKQPKYEEKVGYQAATAYYDEPESSTEEEGSHMSKSDRDAKYGAYKTRKR